MLPILESQKNMILTQYLGNHTVLTSLQNLCIMIWFLHVICDKIRCVIAYFLMSKLQHIDPKTAPIISLGRLDSLSHYFEDIRHKRHKTGFFFYCDLQFKIIFHLIIRKVTAFWCNNWLDIFNYL